MLSIESRNVNYAFARVVEFFEQTSRTGEGIRREPSRNGDVLRVDGPACITYQRPWERVLFNPARDANPFFHVYEALWMLGGRNDLASLEYYVSNFGNYSDDGKTLNGAYGYRWRTHGAQGLTTLWPPEKKGQVGLLCTDQLECLIRHLKNDPHSRRAVLQMWNVDEDLLKVDSSKDVCCNLSVVFEIVERTKSDLRPERFKRVGPNWKNDPEGRKPAEELSESLYGTKEHVRFSTDSQQWFVYNPELKYSCLDMTVFNRSNDAVWGALGANVVHFSFLQEYLAARLNIGIGKYYQISSNLHVYLDKFEPHKWFRPRTMHDIQEPDYEDELSIVPLVRDPKMFEEELHWFLDNNEAVLTEPFLRDVAQPMATAYRHHKERDYPKAKEAMRLVLSGDWRWAGEQWLNRREKKWQKSHSK